MTHRLLKKTAERSLLVTRWGRALLALELWLAEGEGDVPVPDHVLEERKKDDLVGATTFSKVTLN